MPRATNMHGPLAQIVNFGGVPTPLGTVIATLQAEGVPQACIDRYMQGSTLIAALARA